MLHSEPTWRFPSWSTDYFSSIAFVIYAAYGTKTNLFVVFFNLDVHVRDETPQHIQAVTSHEWKEGIELIFSLTQFTERVEFLS